VLSRLKNKIGVLLFAAVFMLGFSGFGLVGIIGFVHTLRDTVTQPQANWVKVVFMVPFATLFPLVGIGAGWIF
jgi:cytochrome bd-type quinol oxidase subunit 1